MKKNILMLYSCLMVITVVFIQTLAFAIDPDVINRRQPDKARYTTRTVENVVIAAQNENVLRIGKRDFHITDQTQFIRKGGKNYQRIHHSTISLPARATITYRRYAQGNEANPYNDKQVVLLKVYLY